MIFFFMKVKVHFELNKRFKRIFLSIARFYPSNLTVLREKPCSMVIFRSFHFSSASKMTSTPEVIQARRTESLDAPEILKLVSATTEKLFGRVNVVNIM